MIWCVWAKVLASSGLRQTRLDIMSPQSLFSVSILSSVVRSRIEFIASLVSYHVFGTLCGQSYPLCDPWHSSQGHLCCLRVETLSARNLNWVRGGHPLSALQWHILGLGFQVKEQRCWNNAFAPNFENLAPLAIALTPRQRPCSQAYICVWFGLCILTCMVWAFRLSMVRLAYASTKVLGGCPCAEAFSLFYKSTHSHSLSTLLLFTPTPASSPLFSISSTIPSSFSKPSLSP